MVTPQQEVYRRMVLIPTPKLLATNTSKLVILETSLMIQHGSVANVRNLVSTGKWWSRELVQNWGSKRALYIN